MERSLNGIWVSLITKRETKIRRTTLGEIMRACERPGQMKQTILQSGRFKLACSRLLYYYTIIYICVYV